MKRLAQKTKVITLIFCLMFFVLNFYQVLKAEPYCYYELDRFCEQQAFSDCNEACDLAEDEPCDYIVWIWSECNWGLCYQWFEFYCDDSGYLETTRYECGIGGCPMK